jgi:hypothetical protein
MFVQGYMRELKKVRYINIMSYSTQVALAV